MTLFDLWLPILLSAVFVFLVSSVVHMALPIHKTDFKGLPDETDLLAAMRDKGVQPGHYAFPFAACMQDMGSEDMLKKYDLGPVGFLTVMPNGPWKMGQSLAIWFGFSLVVSCFVAYASMVSLGAEAGDRVRGRAGDLDPGLLVQPHVSDSIWKGLSWSITAKFVFDGVLYGLTTASTFAWLWPAAA